MTTNMRNLVGAVFTATLLAGSLLTAQHADAASVRRGDGGSIHYYDDSGYDRGYSWCRSGGAGTRCDYDTVDQCRASGAPNSNCVPNPWSYYVAPQLRPVR